MKAIVQNAYGSPDLLVYQEIAEPEMKDDEVLLHVHASSVNSWDWDLIRGTFQGRLGFAAFRAPRIKILGADVAGVIESTGSKVEGFSPGDAVYGDISGRGWGGFSEYVAVRPDVLAHKPSSMSFEQAAATPQAAVLALQALRSKTRIKPGDRVLINGAGGGAGTFAVQLAKSFRAEVTVADKAGKLDMLAALGADHVIDCDTTDFTRTGQRYDFILDVVASRSARAYRRAVSPNGSLVVVGGRLWVIARVALGGFVASFIGSRRLSTLVHRPNRRDLESVSELFEQGAITPVIERTYSLSDVPEALQHFGGGTVKGKIVINVIRGEQT